MKQIALDDLVNAVYMLNTDQSFYIQDYNPETNDGYWYGFQRLCASGIDTDVIVFGICGGDCCIEIIDLGYGTRHISFSDLKEWIAHLLDDRCIEEIWIDEEDWED